MGYKPHMFVRLPLLAIGLWAVSLTAAETPAFSLRGRITAGTSKPSIRIVLENPKARNSVVSTVEADSDGNYEIPNLREREYRVVVWIDGKKQDRRDLHIVCRPGAMVAKDFNFGKSTPTLMIYFPADDPDFVEVAELIGDYPKEVLRDYEAAYGDYINGNIPRSVERLEKVAARAPGFYGVHARLGLIFQDSGCFDDSETEFSRASEISQRSVQPLLNLASVQIRAAGDDEDPEVRIEKALATITRALEIRSDSALAHCLAGSAYLKQGSVASAEKSLKTALQIDGRIGAARLMLASLYSRQQNWDLAVSHFNSYLEDHPEAPDRNVVREMRDEAERKLRAK